MANWFIVAITAQYLIASLAYLWRGEYGSALMFFAYSLANIGFLYNIGVIKL